jgi:ribosomal protein S18 acetylase RimI-like enzyme
MAEIRLADQVDIQKIAICHRHVFPNSLSSALGFDYVSCMLSWYIATENTFLILAEEDGRCVGYCGGMVKTIWGIGSASSMAQYSFNAAVIGFLKKPWLLFHLEVRTKFSFIIKNIINRFFRKDKLTGDATVIFEPYAGLVVIGVDPLFQGKGYGSQLLQEFEKITLKKGLQKMVLSVLTSNKQAITSYTHNGWVVTKVDQESTSMEKRLHQQ